MERIGEPASASLLGVKNQGATSSGSFGVQYYLSRDNIVSSDDVLLSTTTGGSSVSVAGINTGASSSLSNVSVVLPNSLPAGWTGEFFYVVMLTDSGNQVVETNEANNSGQVGQSLDWEPISIFANPSNPGTSSQFTISLSITGMTASQQQIFQQAANRWSQVIVGDLPNATYNGVTVDDVLINASAIAIDGPYGVLGQAGPDRFQKWIVFAISRNHAIRYCGSRDDGS